VVPSDQRAQRDALSILEIWNQVLGVFSSLKVEKLEVKRAGGEVSETVRVHSVFGLDSLSSS
jgi:hypothetical protein